MRAALLLAFGVLEGALVLLAFRIPDLTVSVLVGVMAGFLFLDGVVSVVEAARTRSRLSWLLPRAAAGVVAAVLVATLPPASSLQVFAGWALVTGALDIALAPATGRLATVLALGLGGYILAAPVDAVRLLLGISAYGVLAGLLRLRATVRFGPAGRAW